MAEYNKEKYYWFRMKEDFFKRHDIKIIKAMPNGKDYVIFYLQLLCESVSHNGRLRFSETIPYNTEMLSVITDTNIDIVKSAMDVFLQLKLIEILDDKTIYMTSIDNLIGSQTISALKKQIQIENSRGGKKVEKIPPDIDIDIEKDIDIYKVSKKDIILSYEEVMAECGVKSEPLKEAIYEFIQHLAMQGIKMINSRLYDLIIALDRRHDNEADMIAEIKDTIKKGWRLLPSER